MLSLRQPSQFLQSSKLGSLVLGEMHVCSIHQDDNFESICVQSLHTSILLCKQIVIE